MHNRVKPLLSLPTRGVWIEIVIFQAEWQEIKSLPTRGVWIEILKILSFFCENPVSLPTRECGLKLVAVIRDRERCTSHSPHGECGLKSQEDRRIFPVRRHSPHGECGLKLEKLDALDIETGSLPTRGVWIEIASAAHKICITISHSPHGECGLKYDDHSVNAFQRGHSPHGECGLK